MAYTAKRMGISINKLIKDLPKLIEGHKELIKKRIEKTKNQ